MTIFVCNIFVWEMGKMYNVFILEIANIWFCNTCRNECIKYIYNVILSVFTHNWGKNIVLLPQLYTKMRFNIGAPPNYENNKKADIKSKFILKNK